MKTKIFVTALFLSTFVLSANAQFTKLLDFAGTANGSNPKGSLISDGTFLYGMTTTGGTNNLGTVFKIQPDGTGYAKLLDFTGTVNGSSPCGSLFFDGTFLYGMTYTGGANNLGTVFKIKPDGTGYIRLLNFAGGANGKYPYGSLISDGTFLYGMTTEGGANSLGAVFKVKTDGTGYVKLLDFAGTANGSGPRGDLVSDGTFLYGMTSLGGTNNMGTVFKMQLDGTGYAKLLDFTGTANGSNPYGSLVSDGTFLYGMTNQGGSGGGGTIFKIKPDGSGYVKLLDFTGLNGYNPYYGSLVLEGTSFYGMTEMGGSMNGGNIFKIKPDGTGYAKLHDFTNSINGSYTWGSVLSDGTFLYGMTSNGGTGGLGTVFRYQNVYINENTTICPGQTTTLTAFGGATYSWNTGQSATSITVSPSTNTTYTVTATSGTGVATATVTVAVTSTPTVTVSGTNTICNGQSTTLSVSGGNTYSWASSGATTSSITVSPTTGTTYSVTGTGANGCTSTSTFAIVVDSSAIANAGIDVTIMAGNNATLNGSGNGTYNWNPTTGLDCTTCSNPNSNPTTTTTYTLLVTNSCGTAIDSVTITVVPNTTETSEHTQVSETFLYPNPNNGIFTIENSANKCELSITNLIGEKMFSQKIQSGKTEIDLSRQPTGVYFLTIKNNEGTINKKIILQR